MTDDDHLSARFVAVYLQYKGALFAYAASQSGSAGDLLQEAMAKGWAWFLENPDTTDHDFKLTLFRIIRNTAIDGWRRRQCNPIDLSTGHGTDQGTDPLENVAANGPLPDEVANRPDLVSAVRAAIQHMKDAKERRLLELLYINPKPSLQEVAAKMKITISDAKQVHLRAKKALKKALLSLAKEMNIPIESQHPDISAAIKRIENPEMRTLLELFYADPKPSIKEVAAKMGIEIAYAKKLHKHAKVALKKARISLAKEMNISTETPNHES